ncbi:hypothetical protein IB239_22390 [Pseudomonas sp. PDM12]|uniref:hypothetical protein n=1 Tax=Pseudomonas sp. PDM12 TaxID=2769260 RepID=UPI00177DA978|nr:hypothetical protein [Pseudomonas sp. PDM12]MBD9657587.1 hypothetical protein [Pseudomonas sp. PDM12]
MKTPIDLKLDGKSVATISSFSYETPWATGRVEFKEQSLFRKLVSVSSLSSFDLEMDELGVEEDKQEELWESKLKELGISWADFELKDDGRWSISPCDGHARPIYSPHFYETGFIDWRP